MIGQAPNVDGVSTARTGKVAAAAVCMDCRWKDRAMTGADWLALRARARRHVRTTGHEARAELVTFYVYAPDSQGGQ